MFHPEMWVQGLQAPAGGSGTESQRNGGSKKAPYREKVCLFMLLHGEVVGRDRLFHPEMWVQGLQAPAGGSGTESLRKVRALNKIPYDHFCLRSSSMRVWVSSFCFWLVQISSPKPYMAMEPR